MGWADDLVATVPPAAASAPGGWANELAASKAPAPAQAAPSSWWDGAVGELARQAGLTVRAGVTGVTGLPALVGNGLNTAINYGSKGINSLAGTSIPMLQMPTDVVQKAENAAGLPQPKNATERVVQDAASSMAGAGGTYKLGQALLSSGTPMASAAGRALTAVPANQAIAAGSAGAAAGSAREAGLGPAWQFAAGVLGGTAGGVGSSLAGSALTKAGRVIAPKAGNPAIAAPAVESVTADSPLPPSDGRAADLADRTASFIANNPGADPQAAARAADFRSLGMSPTLGQATRDPGLFAQEQNWRGTSSGAPLLQRFNGQNQQLAQALRQTAGTGSTDLGDAQTIMGALKSADVSLNSRVTQAYQDAAQSTGSQLNVPLQGLAQDYAGVLQRFGDRVPSGVRSSFDSLGLNSGTQKKVFSVADAEDLLKTINQNQSIEPSTNLALKQLGDSVKTAVLGADDQGGAFAPARALAAQRFALHDQVPAMEAAAYGTVAPDDFVRRFVTNGNASDVAGMAGVLRQSSPDALRALQGQVGNRLQTAAFGQNMAGDKVFAPESYARTLNQTFGPDVLKSIYGPDQLDDLNTIGRVGSYINSEPAFSPVNRSNTGSALLDMLNSVPVVGNATSALARRAMIARALRGDLSDTGAVAPTQGNRLAAGMLMGGARPVPQAQAEGQP